MGSISFLALDQIRAIHMRDRSSRPDCTARVRQRG